MDIKEISQTIVGNNYKVCFRNPSKDNMTKIIFGKIQDFNPSGNVVVYVEGLGATQGLYIIPYIWVKWMLPNGLSEQFKDKIGCNFDKKVCVVDLCKGWRLNEIQNKFGDYIIDGNSVLDSTIKTCKYYNLYFCKQLYNCTCEELNIFKMSDKQFLSTFMKRYIKNLDLQQYRDKNFEDD